MSSFDTYYLIDKLRFPSILSSPKWKHFFVSMDYTCSFKQRPSIQVEILVSVFTIIVTFVLTTGPGMQHTQVRIIHLTSVSEQQTLRPVGTLVRPTDRTVLACTLSALTLCTTVALYTDCTSVTFLLPAACRACCHGKRTTK